MAQSAPADPPVLIIGAGVAGLALAQGLRLRSIPFRLFECRAASYSSQGHRFRISKDGQAALNSVLSAQLQGLLAATAPERFRFAPRYVDARKLDFARPTPVDPAETMPVDRTWMRMVAASGIQDAIEYDREFQSYEIAGDQVHARFADGSVIRGRLLVGADGIRSRVRKQLQPDRKLLHLERWIMWGRTALTERLRQHLPQDVLSWCMCLDHEANVQLVVEPMMWSKSVRQASDGSLPDFPDYIYWCVCTAPSRYADAVPRTLDEKRAFLDSVAGPWHPALKLLLGSAMHDSTACIPVLSSKPGIELCSAGRQHARVTLIGDAAHAMSPMGGSGGDTAIQDAADLARTLAEQGITGPGVLGFEERMSKRAKERIEHSFRGGQKFWRGKEWTEYAEIDV